VKLLRPALNMATVSFTSKRTSTDTTGAELK
jgi:hypothetical protein